MTATKQKQINEANGQTEAIKAVAIAREERITSVANAIRSERGMEAVQLLVAEKLVEQFGNVAKATNAMILPENFGDTHL